MNTNGDGGKMTVLVVVLVLLYALVPPFRDVINGLTAALAWTTDR